MSDDYCLYDDVDRESVHDWLDHRGLEPLDDLLPVSNIPTAAEFIELCLTKGTEAAMRALDPESRAA